MLNLDKVIEHCERVAGDYEGLPITEHSFADDMYINQGWLEALRFVKRNFTVKPKQYKKGE